MGNILQTVLGERSFSRKRKFKDIGLHGRYDDDLALDGMPTPKRKKLMSTSRYIYKTLFENGESSDVTIIALGKEWHLHKVYLCQSPYFSSMFCGSWKEAQERSIEIGIEDPNITSDALWSVFGSLYQDEIIIDPAKVVPVLAASTLFQLDAVIQQCIDIMADDINIHTALRYYDASHQYGLKFLSQKSFDWLLRNLMLKVQEYCQQLKNVSLDLMKQLVINPSLVVIQTEFSLYILLKCWVFLCENNTWEGDAKDCALEAHKYFQSFSKNSYFLTSSSGEQYTSVFRALHLSHLINHHLDMELLEMDRIIPMEWLYPIFRSQWFLMLKVDQGVERGPQQVTEEEFDNNCLRCGRLLTNEGQHIWRWTGFNFGLDLVVTYNARAIRFRRNQRSDANVYESSSHHFKRHLMYRLSVYSQDRSGQVLYTNTTDLKSIALIKNEEVKVLTLDPQMQFPLVLSANFLVITPQPPEAAAKTEATSIYKELGLASY